MVVSVPFPLESGLSECARYPSVLGCDGLDSGLALFVLGIPGVVVWLLLAGSATAMIAKRHPTRSAVWLAVVWCLPILGALCWFVYRVGIRASRRTTAGQRHHS
ncbi:PLDc N-terminal domain-containing protein [Mycobacterium paraffinicum]|uniref:PLDc N-terminal domain-containing protein n=1 Tax=Mycobacterium paraffinicum TaxID=53378 RepID=UPI00142E4AEF|nr:PLDc N-terminal domain-containing protein [Mycobacterium paraffinicum]